MTDTELRELDRFIAEHVMGWQWWRFKSTAGEWCQMIPAGEKWPHARWGAVLCESKVEGIEDETDLSIFKPTTNPADAMLVLEKCAEHCDMPIEIDRKRDNKTGHWRVESGIMSQGLVAIAPECHNTLPLAIVLFAKQLFGNGKV